MYPYRTYLVRDLKRILRLRGLRVCGKKAELVARLEQNDEDHPFPFSKLPPEIRNMIYNLSSQNIYGHKKSHKAVYAYDLLNGPNIAPRRRQQMAFNNTDITLFHSDYYGTPFLNTILVDLATYIHTLRDWLFGNGADAPVFKFEQTIEYIDANPIKTLSYVQRWHRESDPVFLETPATLIASSQTAHYLAKRPSIFPHSILPSETP
ncbi:MAG: hypothetical protein OHK93_008013 [Ramalina farinacea]|uniref:SAP domain-containing protein n=1 Tax=Ramalina farinacea TaxID=258253 RepID=A0AA43QMU1_9LECA|nr:hypothetical protein [Ramalina farinacea]